MALKLVSTKAAALVVMMAVTMVHSKVDMMDATKAGQKDQK
jgi:hypothetical protein